MRVAHTKVYVCGGAGGGGMAFHLAVKTVLIGLSLMQCEYSTHPPLDVSNEEVIMGI